MSLDFLDHVMRQKPSDTLVSIKRNFYAPKANRAPLDTFLEVIKGTYSAFRLSDVSQRYLSSENLLTYSFIFN